MTKNAKHTGRTATRRSSVGGYKVLGTTKDGVKILKPGRATHFTDKELRDAIKATLARQKAQ